jgi:hypothetical protein
MDEHFSFVGKQRLKLGSLRHFVLSSAGTVLPPRAAGEISAKATFFFGFV